MNHKFSSTLAAAAVALASQPAAATPVLTYDQSTPHRLIGATGVSVNGSLYDVSFSGGSCVSRFDGCTGSDFIATADAAAAGQAILDLVETAFSQQSIPNLTFISGCSNAYSRCVILTPYAVDNGTVSVEAAVSTVDFATDPVGLNQQLELGTYGAGDATNASTAFAIFTAEAAPASVPEPASTALVAVGLAAAAASLGRRRGA